MTKDEVIEIARFVGFRVADQFAAAGTEEDMIAFAKLVALNEREKCAKVCEDAAEDGSHMDGYDTAYNCATAIRAKGEA
jgi:hypothetical protein